MVKSYNFDPAGNVFIKHKSKSGFSFHNQINIYIVDCDQEMTHHQLTGPEARDLAAHLMQAADEFDKAEQEEKANV